MNFYADQDNASQASNSASSQNNSSNLKSPPRRFTQLAQKQNHWIGNLNLSARQQSKRVQVIVTATKSQYQPKARISKQVVTEIEERLQTKIEHQKNSLNENGNGLMLKELTNKNIEITKLRESCSVLRTENETLSLILREKESEVEMLQKRIEDTVSNQKKIENYQLAINQSKSLFKDIEEQMKIADKEGKIKDKTIEEYKSRIQTFTAQTKIQQERISILERSVSELTSNDMKLQQQNTELRKECQEWKTSYFEASRHVEQLPQMEIKLRNSLSTNKDLQDRINELLAINEKLKLQVGGQTMRDRRLNQLEGQIQSLNRQNRQKAEEIENLTEKIAYLQQKHQNSSAYQESITQLQRQLDQRNRQYKTLQRKFEQKSIIITNQQRQLKRIADQLSKFRQRGEKIDHVSRENKRLANLLIDKIDLIEQLQMQLNTAQSKLAGVTNQSTKLSSLYEQASQSNKELKTTCETLRNQLEVETNLKVQLTDKCSGLSVEIGVLTSTLAKEKQMTRTIISERESLKVEIQQITKKYQESNSRLEILRSESEAQISHDRSKIEQISAEFKQTKKKLDIYLKKDKQQTESLRISQSKTRQLESLLTKAQNQQQEALQQIKKLTKWKHQYLRFMDTFSQLGQKMTDYSQALL